MPATLMRAPANRSSHTLRIGIVNNMPDAALANTLRQFLDVLDAASHGQRVQLVPFALPGVPRNELGQHHLIDNAYLDTVQLPSMALDGLIATGTEPKHANLRHEPYWPALASLFDWIDREGPPAIFSCLAAHAAVLHFDGIERRRLNEKCFGFFSHTVAAQDALTANLPRTFNVAHSRCNEVPAGALGACGYRVLTSSPDAGADLFVAQRRNPMVFFQGHPEYDMRALGREYQRDVKRFLTAERDTYPAMPRFYFNPTEQELLAEFRDRAETNRNETLMTEFPPLAERLHVAQGTSPVAATVYGAWLRQLAEADTRAHRAGWEPAPQRVGA